MKYYFLFFFIFCLLVGGGLYTLNPSPISVGIFSYNLSLPLSLWILGSVILFFGISLFFFANHWIGGFLRKYRQEKDSNRLINQIYDQILQKPILSSSYQTQIFKTLSKILQRVDLQPRPESAVSENEQIDQLFLDLKSLNEGKIIKTTLKEDTPFWIKNTQNKISSDPKFAQKIVEGDYDSELKRFAILELIQNGSLNEKLIQKIVRQNLDQENAQNILQYFLDKGYKLGQAEIMELVANFDSKALIRFFNQSKDLFDPDFCIELFGKLASQNPEAKNAYVYVLIDFSMFDKAKEFLKEHDELILARAYIDLKENGKSYPFDQFFV